VEGDLVPKMWAAARVAFAAVGGRLNPARHRHCFELFGLDFMVDAELRARPQHVCMKNADLNRNRRARTDHAQ